MVLVRAAKILESFFIVDALKQGVRVITGTFSDSRKYCSVPEHSIISWSFYVENLSPVLRNALNNAGAAPASA